ncbi:DUF2927 domain-containing protein [Oceanicella actignis]|uniref:DUF2927 domain-containing protein n=1 Tax=Oceanicella actignis TaxID=1189325 RepID=UPI0011E7714C|nr:DUF2927 domain-containing protein [Oceanicella actignis]TYO90197.1 Protein of unknown function (DUF2927) [Oceanicella actignis]
MTHPARRRRAALSALAPARAPAPGRAAQPRRPARPRLSSRAARLCAAAALAALAGGCAQSLADRYAALERAHVRQGLLRLDRDPADAPFDAEDLARDFERIAFHKEFADGPGLIAAPTPTQLIKWDGEVTWTLTGDGVREDDRRAFRALTARLSALTGLRFSERPAPDTSAPDTPAPGASSPDQPPARGGRAPDEDAQDEGARVMILIAGPELRRAAGILAAGMPGNMDAIAAWARDDSYPCVGQVGWRGEGPGRDQRAIVAIKAETAGRLRLSCIHEELTQILGLVNDDPEARPSIFNDDQEFAALTRHDELLLRILYDPRLRHGMTAEEGMPIVRRIIAELAAAGEVAPARHSAARDRAAQDFGARRFDAQAAPGAALRPGAGPRARA